MKNRIIANADPVKLAKVQNRMIVAAKIADAMKAKNLNQKQFAQLMGRTKSEIKRPTDLSTVRRLGGF